MKSKSHVCLFLISVFLCSTTSGATVSWINGIISPNDWAIDPLEPNETDLIMFSGPSALSINSCYAEITYGGTPMISVDTLNKVVELSFQEPAPDQCVAVWQPVCGLQGDFGPLTPGSWIFRCTDPAIDFEIQFTVSNTATPNTYYVDQDSPSSTPDGSSWKKAFKNIQDALDVAIAGDTILVAEGIYKPDQGDSVIPGDRMASCELKDGVNLYGGYAGYGHIYPDERNTKKYPTVISGDLSDDDMNMLNKEDNSYHIVSAIGKVSDIVLVDGFVITAGQADGPASYSTGGGIYISGMNVILINCSISDNIAGLGGGISCESGSLSMWNCMITGNKSKIYGGGIYSYSATMSMTNCLLVGNSAAQAEFFGGSAVFNLGGDLTISSCTIADNFAPNGMAITSFTWSLPKFMVFMVTNSILYNGGNEVFTNYKDDVFVFNTDIQGGWAGMGIGNINANPLFVEQGFWDITDVWNNGNYQLQSSSLCIDQGDNLLLPQDIVDLDGDSDISEALPVDINDTDRIKNAIVDMGAYESTSSYTPEPNESVRTIGIAIIVPDDIGPSYPPRNYSVPIPLTFNMNFQATLRVEIEAASAAGGTWSAWFDPDPGVVGPGEVTVNVEVRGSNVDIAQLPPGQQTVARLRIFIQPQP